MQIAMAHATISTQPLVEKTIHIGEETIAYYDNEKDGTTLLFIHGAFINKGYWDEQLSAFSSAYRVVALDLAGHGHSSHRGSDWTFKKYGSDVNEFIKKLSLRNVIIIGHSNGADIMLEVVTLNNAEIIGIIAVDYFKNVGVPIPEKLINQTIESLKADFANTSENYAKQRLLTPGTDKTIADKVIRDYRTMDPEVGIPFNESGFNYGNRETELLKKLPLKLYLINADYLPTSEKNLEKQTGDNYELNVISGSSHFPMIEEPEAFNEVLDRIILKIRPD